MTKTACRILLVFGLYSCSQYTDVSDLESYIPTKVKNLSSHILEQADTLYLQIDSLTSGNQYYGQVINENSRYWYVIFNNNINALQFYDLESGGLSRKIKFESEGANGLSDPDRFYYHTKDSIFFIDSNSNVLWLFNGKGKLQFRKNIKFPNKFSQHLIQLDNFYQFTYLPDLKAVTFWIYPAGKMSYDDYEYWTGSKAAIYFLKNDSLKAFGRFPNNYFQKNQLFEFFEFINSVTINNSIYLYFHGSEDVIKYNYLSEEVNYLNIPSNYFSEPEAIMKIGQKRPSFREVDVYHTETNMISRLISNPHADFVYRIIKLSVPHDLGNGKIQNFNNKPFAIQVLDKDFNILSEERFKGGKYDFYQSFSLKNQLFVSLGNELNEFSSDESKLPIAVFKLKLE